MAAAPADRIDVEFVDGNLQKFGYDDPVDFVGISMMLTTESAGGGVADEYHQRGVKIIFSGIATMLHAEET